MHEFGFGQLVFCICHSVLLCERAEVRTFRIRTLGNQLRYRSMLLRERIHTQRIQSLKEYNTRRIQILKLRKD